MQERNYSEMLADGFAGSSRFADSAFMYPELVNCQPDEGVIAEWFYPVLTGPSEGSELRAILNYTAQNAYHATEIGNVVLGIAFVEMQHYSRISELIHRLGGRIRGTGEKLLVEAGNSPQEALEKSIAGERDAIVLYEGIRDKLDTRYETFTVTNTRALLDKIIADEQLHIKLLTEKLRQYETGN